MRIPLFVWTIEAYAVLLVLVLPTISAAVTLLLLDRQAGTTFFTGDNGALLWQHMFWFFGHPEVYIMVLPAMGILGDHPGLLAQADLRLQGDRVLDDRNRVCQHARLGAPHVHGGPGRSAPVVVHDHVVSYVPTAIKIFNWLATLWRGNLWFRAPLYFCSRLHRLFTMGGLGDHACRLPGGLSGAGLLLRRRPLPLRAAWGTVFGIFAGTYYWFPKITGRMYDERLARSTSGSCSSASTPPSYPSTCLA